jgi:alkanesulfonate monooxygenase SsuD/methylene tetrahydromethanopterin reductase-like flavin-dependent oxidoreductase (luciferase family)
MGMKIEGRAARDKRLGMLAEFAELVHDLLRGAFDPYRPELHYMRGPGPKWHAKHHLGRAIPELVRVRVKR